MLFSSNRRMFKWKDGQRVGITFAEDYELEKQITKLKGGSN